MEGIARHWLKGGLTNLLFYYLFVSFVGNFSPGEGTLRWPDKVKTSDTKSIVNCSFRKTKCVLVIKTQWINLKAFKTLKTLLEKQSPTRLKETMLSRSPPPHPRLLCVCVSREKCRWAAWPQVGVCCDPVPS